MAPRAEDGPALPAVFDQHVWDVYGFFAYRLGNRHDAEDLTQATFERAVRAWGRFDPRRASAKTWLLAIAKNLLIDHHRRVRPTEELAEDEISDLADRESFAPMPDGLDPELAAVLGSLNARDLEVVALRFGGDLTGPEIADLMDLTLSNVQQILSRSLRRLRSELDGSVLARERSDTGEPDPGDR